MARPSKQERRERTEQLAQIIFDEWVGGGCQPIPELEPVFEAVRRDFPSGLIGRSFSVEFPALYRTEIMECIRNGLRDFCGVWPDDIDKRDTMRAMIARGEADTVAAAAEAAGVSRSKAYKLLPDRFKQARRPCTPPAIEKHSETHVEDPLDYVDKWTLITEKYLRNRGYTDVNRETVRDFIQDYYLERARKYETDKKAAFDTWFQSQYRNRVKDLESKVYSEHRKRCAHLHLYHEMRNGDGHKMNGKPL